MQQDFYRIRPATVADALAMAQVKQITWEATYRGIYPDAKLDNYSIPENVQKFEKIIRRKSCGAAGRRQGSHDGR